MVERDHSDDLVDAMWIVYHSQNITRDSSDREKLERVRRYLHKQWLKEALRWDRL